MPERQKKTVSRWFGRSVLRMAGWRIQGELPDLDRMVVIVAPHTSNWDFILLYAAKMAVGLSGSWLGKHTIFFWPLSLLLRWMGGIPVNRSARQGIVDQVVGLFRSREYMVLGLSPEGTRRRVEKWKTGFYQIALNASVPIALVGLDFGTKSVDLGFLVEPTGDLESDMQKIREYYAPMTGKHPEQFCLPVAGQ